MRSRSSKIVIITGFSLILILLSFISILAWYSISGNNHSLDDIVTKQEKFDEIFTMRDVAHTRVLLLYLMSNTDDVFERDDLYMQYLDHADVFMQARDRFRSHGEGENASSEYVESWNQVSVLVRNGAGAQNVAIDLIEQGKTAEARELLHQQVIPNQKRVIAGYTYLLETQHKIIADQLKAVQSSNQYHLIMIISLGIAALITGGLIALYVTRYNALIQNNLVKQTRAAEEASRSKSYFLANMSHEIRTPLASIIGFSDALLTDEYDDDKRKQVTETIIRNGRHLHQIINDILDISKIEAGQLVTEHIATSPFMVLSEIDWLLGNEARAKGLYFIIRYHFPIPINLLTDPTRLKQILINLCSNAIKFTHEGGIRIDVYYNAEPGEIVFKVQDTGIGMTPDEARHIFNPFTQADGTTTRKYGGTGLGLSISSKLARELGGRLTSESNKNEGSTFTLHLRVDNKQTLTLINSMAEICNYLDDESPQVDIRCLQGEILLAEDTPDNQQLIAMHIGRAGANLTIVENGKMAVDAAMSKEYDLILMDTQMPIMDGVEATRRLREQGYYKPIISLTANAMMSDRAKCIAAGADEYLVKPLDLKRFYDILNKYLTEVEDTGKTEQHGKTSIEELNAAFRNNPQFKAMVDRFLEKLPSLSDEIVQLVKDGNWDDAQLKSHDLKGMGGAMGYPQITEISAQLNTEIKQKKYTQAEKTCGQLHSICLQANCGNAAG